MRPSVIHWVQAYFFLLGRCCCCCCNALACWCSVDGRPPFKFIYIFLRCENARIPQPTKRILLILRCLCLGFFSRSFFAFLAVDRIYVTQMRESAMVSAAVCACASSFFPFTIATPLAIILILCAEWCLTAKSHSLRGSASTSNTFSTFRFFFCRIHCVYFAYDDGQYCISLALGESCDASPIFQSQYMDIFRLTGLFRVRWHIISISSTHEKRSTWLRWKKERRIEALCMDREIRGECERERGGAVTMEKRRMYRIETASATNIWFSFALSFRQVNDWCANENREKKIRE